MPPSLRTLLITLLLADAVWQPAGVSAEDNCEQAKADYDRAVQQTDARQALALLDGVIARCPNFNAWFVKANAHRMLEQWDEALASYRQAHDAAGEPKLAFMAQAYGALMQHRLGRTCEAARTFQVLGAGSDAPLPARVREPYEAFERRPGRGADGCRDDGVRPAGDPGAPGHRCLSASERPHPVRL